MWFNSVQILVFIRYLCVLFYVEHIMLVLHEFLSCSKKLAELCSSRLYGIVFVFCLFAFVGDK
jgi:hypothetical protein